MSPSLWSDRLELRPLTAEMARAVVDGERDDSWAHDFPQDGDMVIARLTHDRGQASADASLFGHHHVFERSTGTLVGTAGFFGPPGESGDVTLGYGIVPSARGRGIATEAVRCLVELATSDERVRSVLADTTRLNVASQRVLERVGFTPVSDDGDTIYFALALRA